MNLAHCIHGLGLGGAQKVIAALVRGQQSAGNQHFVYSCNDGVLGQEVRNAGATVRIIPRVMPWLDPVWIRRLQRAMKLDSIELVHGHLFGDSLHGYLAAAASGQLPFVMTLHSNRERYSLKQKIAYRWLLERCDMAIACSESVRSSFLERYPELENKITVVRNGLQPITIDPQNSDRMRNIREELGLLSKGIILGSFGRLTKVKGQRFLLEAFASLCKEYEGPIQLVFVGEGPLLGDLQSQAESEGVGENVIFAGYRQDVPEIMSVVDVVAFSSLQEGLPITLLEAMSLERCIVATKIPSFVEVISDSKEGLLAEAGNANSLYEALSKAVENENLRSSLACAAGLRFLEDFSASSMISGYQNVYRTCLADRRSKKP